MVALEACDLYHSWPRSPSARRASLNRRGRVRFHREHRPSAACCSTRARNSRLRVAPWHHSSQCGAQRAQHKRSRLARTRSAASPTPSTSSTPSATRICRPAIADPATEAPRCDTVAVVVDQQKIEHRLQPDSGRNRDRVASSTQDGRPIAGATVRLGLPRFDARFATSKPAQTNRDGSFSMTNLPVGGYLMEVDLPQAPGALRPPIVYFPGVLMFGDASFVELVAGEITNDLTIVAPRLVRQHADRSRGDHRTGAGRTGGVVRAGACRWSHVPCRSTRMASATSKDWRLDSIS